MDTVKHNVFNVITINTDLFANTLMHIPAVLSLSFFLFLSRVKGARKFIIDIKRNSYAAGYQQKKRCYFPVTSETVILFLFTLFWQKRVVIARVTVAGLTQHRRFARAIIFGTIKASFPCIVCDTLQYLHGSK